MHLNQNMLKMKQNKTKVHLWKVLLGLTLTYTDSSSQLTADVMDQCIKHE